VARLGIEAGVPGTATTATNIATNLSAITGTGRTARGYFFLCALARRVAILRPRLLLRKLFYDVAPSKEVPQY
jgi:hypothetical protein